jgi:hypothetical protein
MPFGHSTLALYLYEIVDGIKIRKGSDDCNLDMEDENRQEGTFLGTFHDLVPLFILTVTNFGSPQRHGEHREENFCPFAGDAANGQVARPPSAGLGPCNPIRLRCTRESSPPNFLFKIFSAGRVTPLIYPGDFITGINERFDFLCALCGSVVNTCAYL